MTKYRVVQKKDRFYLEKKGWLFWNCVRMYSDFLGNTVSYFHSKERVLDALDNMVRYQEIVKAQDRKKLLLPSFAVIKEVEIDD